MRYIKYNLEIGYCGCNDEGVLPVPDGMPNNAIDDMVNSMAQEHASSWEGDERLGFTSPDDEDYTDELAEQEVEDFYANVDGDWEFITEDEAKNEGFL
jgi:hypothetical protein